MSKEELMRLAVELACENVERGGGPFGAVVARQGEVVASAVNAVTLNNDPTAHAEIMAIREAGRLLGTFDLSSCEIYTSCEPCPMCLSAIYWARIGNVYYAATQRDAEQAGFDDAFIYRELEKPAAQRSLLFRQTAAHLASLPFDRWKEKEDKTPY